MPVAGAAVAGVLALGALGFGAGYAVAGMGGDDGGAKPVKKTGDPVLPAVPTPSSQPKIVVLGSAPSLPAPRRRAKRPARSAPGPGPASTPAPNPTAAPTSAPTAAPTAAPPSAPPPKPPPPPPPDDIIEG